jgi:hypothetical protein
MIRLVIAIALGAFVAYAAFGFPPPCTGGNPVGQAILNLVCQ